MKEGKAVDSPRAEVFGTEDATGTTRPGLLCICIYIYIYLYTAVGRSADRHLARIAAMIFQPPSPSPFSFAFLSPGRGAQQAWNPANFLPFAPPLLPPRVLSSIPSLSFPPTEQQQKGEGN